MKRILVLGGTGFVGRAVCEKLIEHHPDARIVVPTRHASHGNGVKMLPTVDLAVADVHDSAALGRLVAGCDAVINLIAILHGSQASFQRVHVELLRHLVHACRSGGVQRLLHVSALGLGPAGSTAPSDYLRSKAAGEAVLATSGLAVTVLRPSVIFGMHDRFINLFAQLQSLVPVVPLAGSHARFQPVWVEDVAEALVRCLGRPDTIGQTYECAGPQELTLSEIVRLAGRWAGHERPQIPLPAWAGSLQGLVMEMLPGTPLMSRDNVRSMSVPNVASGRLPGLQALGITPTPLDAVAPDYVGQLYRRQALDRFRAGVGRR